MTKQIVRFGAAIMTTLLALLVVWQFRIVILYVLISLTLAATLRPLVSRLAGRPLAVRAAWILIYLIVFGIFGFSIFLIGKAAINDVQQLGNTLAVQDEWILPIWLNGSSFQQLLVSWLPPPSTLFEAITGNKGQLVLPAILGITQDIAAAVSGFIIILFLSIYWIVNQIHFERLWLSLLPSGQRKQARDIWRTIEPDLGAYIRGQVYQGLLVGLLLGFGYWAIGSPFPVLLALASTLLCLIPVIGGPLAIIPTLLMGLLTSVQLSLFTVLFTIVVLIAFGTWIMPRLFNRRWDNPILTLVILLALANAFGILGIIVAPPISAVCQILWSTLVSHRLAPGAADQFSDLKERQNHVWDTIRALDGPPIALVTSSMERLAHLIDQAEPLLQTSSQPNKRLDGSSEPLQLLQPVSAVDEEIGSTKPGRI